MRGLEHDPRRRAINVPLNLARSGHSRLAAVSDSRRPRGVRAGSGQIPKLTVRVRFSSPAPIKSVQFRASAAVLVGLTRVPATPSACPLRIPLRSRMEVDHRSARGRVPHPRHQVRQRGAGFGRKRVAGMPEVVTPFDAHEDEPIQARRGITVQMIT